jgi:signal transduction histidine kinase
MNSITPVVSLADTAKRLVDESLAELPSTGKVDVAGIRSNLVDVQQAVSTVARRSGGLMRFVENYRSLRQLPKPSKQKVNVHKLISNVELLLVDQWKTPNLEFKQCIPGSIEIYADPDLLEQLFINLLKNSDHALLHHKNPTIEVRAELDAYSRVKVSVIDNGPGIDQEKQKLVFLPFYSNKPEGSGIGLALARQIMITHDGSIRLEPSANEGCHFILLF